MYRTVVWSTEDGRQPSVILIRKRTEEERKYLARKKIFVQDDSAVKVGRESDFFHLDSVKHADRYRALSFGRCTRFARFYRIQYFTSLRTTCNRSCAQCAPILLLVRRHGLEFVVAVQEDGNRDG